MDEGDAGWSGGSSMHVSSDFGPSLPALSPSLWATDGPAVPPMLPPSVTQSGVWALDLARSQSLDAHLEALVRQCKCFDVSCSVALSGWDTGRAVATGRLCRAVFGLPPRVCPKWHAWLLQRLSAPCGLTYSPRTVP